MIESFGGKGEYVDWSSSIDVGSAVEVYICDRLLGISTDLVQSTEGQQFSLV